jgi:type II secretory pathway pseudopilin PulG
MDDLPVRTARGFRLVDLLVIVGILGVLAALIIPAIQQVQEAAARTQCQNNLKQMTLAIHDYASTYNNALPPLSGAPRQDRDGTPLYHPQSMLLTMLPFIEQDHLYPAALREPWGCTWNAPVPEEIDDPGELPRRRTTRDTGQPIYRSAFIKTFVCPSDSSNSATEPTARGWVGSSYAANAQVFGSTPEMTTGSETPATVWNILRSDYNIGNIPDGTANTIFIAERFAVAGSGTGSTPCAWVNPSAGGSALSNTDALGCPLQKFVGQHGDVWASVCGPGMFFGCGTQADPVGAIAGDGSVRMYPLPEIGVRPALAATDGRAQSQHSKVLQVGMGDGSVRGVSRQVGQAPWVRVISPNDGTSLGEKWEP